MRGDWPSLTAMAVAFGRGVGTTAHVLDPLAARLLPRPMGAALALTHGAVGRTLARGVTLGMVDHVCLRTAAIDAAVLAAKDDGCRQLVVLGAGLDARAWRMDALHDVDVFEVDHPATQAAKRARVATSRPCAASVRFVAVDFERERLDTRLVDEGHDAAVPTAWIWEGVTPYLHPAAIHATLADIGARSAPGSHLMMTYAVPELVLLPIPGARSITRLAFRGLGEALHGAMTPTAAAQAVLAVGLRPIADGDARSWAEHAHGCATLARPFRAERLLVAVAD